MSDLNVGIIGLGGIARAHCDALQTLDNIDLVAVADLEEENRQKYVGQYDIPKAYPHHSKLLEDESIDAVAVVNGHQLHHQLVVDACNAGKHVLVEKPMALSLEQCDAMIEAAAANNVKLMVGYSQHYYGTSLKAKEILDSNELGPVMTAVTYMAKNWNHSGRKPQYRSRFHGGGMWLTNGVHVVDRLTWVIGAQAHSVSAVVGNYAHYQASDDSTTAFVRYKNGRAGVAVTSGFADGGPTHECHVICTNGSLRFSQHGEKFVKVGKGNEWKDVSFDDPPAEMHHEWKQFTDSIIRDIEPPTSGEWGRHIMEILFAAEESSITGKEVVLESGGRWINQTSGSIIAAEHGRI